MKEENWPVKFTFRTDKLEGELDDSKEAVCGYISSKFPDVIGILAAKCSSWMHVIRSVAWLLRLVPRERRPR